MASVRDIDEANFPSFVADLWDHQGWTTQINSVEGEAYVAAVQTDPQPQRGLIWAKSGTTGARVDGNAVLKFAKFCRENGVDDAGVLTLGEFTEDGRKAAEKFDIQLVDGQQLTALVERHNLDNLVANHATESSESDGDSGGVSPISAITNVISSVTDSSSEPRVTELISGPLESVRTQLSERGIGISPKVAVGAFAVAALIIAGVVVGPTLLGSLPFIGGGGETAAPAVSLSAAPIAPGQSATTLYVEWNATSKTIIDANTSDEYAFYPPNGTRFVIIKWSITNTGEQAVTLHPAMFTVAANGSTYRYQPLRGAAGFEETTVGPGESHEGWTAYAIPTTETTGTIDISQESLRHPVSAQFAEVQSLPIDVSR